MAQVLGSWGVVASRRCPGLNWGAGRKIFTGIDCLQKPKLLELRLEPRDFKPLGHITANPKPTERKGHPRERVPIEDYVNPDGN